MEEFLKMLNPKAWIALLVILTVEYIAAGWLGKWTVNFVDKRWGLFKSDPKKEEAS